MNDDEMLPEYDVAKMPGGMRGKYAAAYREGHSVVISGQCRAALLDSIARTAGGVSWLQIMKRHNDLSSSFTGAKGERQNELLFFKRGLRPVKQAI